MSKLKFSSNKVLTGTAAGLAEFLGLDPKIIRIIFVAALICYGSGLGIYAICWLIMFLTKE